MVNLLLNSTKHIKNNSITAISVEMHMDEYMDDYTFKSIWMSMSV